MALPYLGAAFGIVGAAVLTTDATRSTVFVSNERLIRTVLWIVAVLFGIQVIVRHRRGGSRLPPLSGLVAVLLVQIGGTFLFAPLGNNGAGYTLSRSDRLIVVVVTFTLLAGTLRLGRNPVRFPDHFDSQGIARSPLTWLFIRHIHRFPPQDPDVEDRNESTRAIRR